MHGLIFVSFRDYLASRFDSGTAADVFAGEPLYAMSDAYDDDRFAALLERASARSGEPASDLLYDFGRFTGETVFPRLYPAFYEIAGGTAGFLLTVEDRIHELVRATIPSARPPELSAEPIDGGVRLTYSSPRHLCRLLSGLATGTARHYGEHGDVVEATCMLRGDDACRFDVRIGEPRAADGV